MRYSTIRHYGTLAAAALLALLAAASTLTARSDAAAAASPRQHLRLDDNWRFALDRSPHKRAPQGVPVSAWRYTPSANDALTLDTVSAVPTNLDTSPDWASVAVGTDVFHGKVGFAWFQTQLAGSAAPAAGTRRMLHFEGVDDNAVVFFNGKLLKRHRGYDDPFDVDLNAAWQAGGPNTVTVLVENTAGVGGIMEPVSLQDTPLHPDAARSAPPIPAEARTAFNASSWRVVHLPHDYVIDQTFTPTADTGHGSLPTPPAWYRRTFDLPASDRGKVVDLQFEGVYRDATVYLNGVLLGEHPGGYTGFHYDISRAARYGARNILAVHVEPSQYEGWFYEGGGIYRHVWLNVTNPVHIAHGGIYVTTHLPEPDSTGKAASAQVTVQTSIANQSAAPASVVLCAVIQDQAENVAATTLTPASVVPAGKTATLTQTLTVAHPQLWGLDAPHLYHAFVTVIRQGRTPDQYTATDQDSATFGIRTLRFDPQRGFFLNGRRTEIQGTCNHQDFAGVGIGIPDSLLYWRVKKLKEMGCNAYRCSHNPVAPALLDACDKLGMLVMDENRHLGDTYRSKSSNDTPLGDLADLKEMMLQDRNHPSVIMWSLCNEEFAIQGTQHGADLFAAMKRVAKRYDATRPYTCAMNGDFGAGISNVEDLQGFNYNINAYDNYHKGYPNQPCFGSETSSEVTTRGEYADDPAKGYVQAYDIESPVVNWGASAEDGWKAIATRPWMEGAFVWTGFDYKGEPTPYGWPDINSNFGILDEAGFPKDNFFYYQAVWSGKPVVHIVPGSWNWAGQEGKPIKVWVYSNADTVELFLNGKSLGQQPMPRYGHAEWMVPYQPGVLKAQGAIGYTPMGSDQIETAGAPAAVQLTVDKAAPTVLKADGEDASIVNVAIVDAQGRLVPDAVDQVTFSSSSPAAAIAGTGNGDPSDHDPDRATQRKAFHGRCMAVVQASEGQRGTATITASAPGLKPSSVTLKVLPAANSDL